MSKPKFPNNPPIKSDVYKEPLDCKKWFHKELQQELTIQLQLGGTIVFKLKNHDKTSMTNRKEFDVLIENDVVIPIGE